MKTAKTKSSVAPAKKESAFFSKDSDQDSLHPAENESTFFSNKTYSGSPVQTKLSIGKVNDVYEKEADAVADKVVQRLATPEKITFSDSSVQSKSIVPPVRSFAQTKNEESENEKNLEQKDEENSGEKLIHRKPIFESNAESDDENKNLQRKENSSSNETASPSIEKKLSNSKASGNVLPQNINQSMSNAIGSDFSNVKIHNDSNAAQMSKDLNAQAFTHGNDIYFNSGKYDTNTTAGKHLLAHELTHTVQQGNNIRRKQDDKKKPKPPLNKATDAELDDQKQTKGQFKGFFKKKGSAYELHIEKLLAKRYLKEEDVKIDLPFEIPKPSKERKTKQMSIWKKNVKEEVGTLLSNICNVEEKDKDELLKLALKNNKAKGLIGTFKQVIEEVIVPFWGQNGSAMLFDVEHMIDWQLVAEKADKIENLILLDRSYNRTLGNEVKVSIHKHIKSIAEHYSDEFKVNTDPENLMANYTVKVDSLDYQEEKIKKEQRYTKDDLLKSNKGSPKDGAYLKKHIEIAPAKIPKGHFLLKTTTGRAGYILPNNAKKEKVGTWIVTTKYNNKTEELESIKLELAVDDKDKIIEAGKGDLNAIEYKKFDSNVYQIEGTELRKQFGLAFKELQVKPFSPIVIDEPDLDGFNAKVSGKIIPTLSFLKDVDISFYFENGEFEIRAEVPLTSIGKNIPKPFEVTNCSLIIAAGSREGLSIAGNLAFRLGKFGEGELTAGINSRMGFYLNGSFDFDSKYFDPATISFDYEKGKWSIKGIIGVAEGKIKGVKRGTLTVGYKDEKFTAEGDAELTVPGVEKLILTAEFDLQGNFAFTAEVALGKLPGIKSGNVKVTVKSNEGEEGIKLRVEGKASPDFPSVKELSGDIIILYEDGIFDARLKITYKKGRFDGTIEVGVTNKKVDDKGQPVGEPEEKGDVVVFGFGSLTVELFKNIKGTVTVRLTPERDLLVAGEIEVKDLSPFGDGYKFEKELLKFPRITIPLVGIPGLSISAFVDGGVYFKFSWQPLILKQLKVGFKETNINEIENATVDIHGSVGSIADAEVYMTINAGLEARVLVATLSGSIGGEAGLGINAEAGGDIDASWNKDKGLQLKEIRAFMNVTPRAVFRLTGKVSVDLDLWITTVNLYSHKYVFAEKALDLSGLSLKADFPIRFDDDNNVIMPPVDKINLQKPDFSGSQGKDILDKAINGDAENELAEKKQQIQAEVKQSLREKSKEEDFSFSDYTDKMVEKYGKSDELKEFVLKTIEEESRAMEYERFEETKTKIRSFEIPLANKMSMVDVLSMFNRYVNNTDVQAFKEELIRLEEEKKLKAEQANKDIPLPDDNKQMSAPLPPPPPPSNSNTNSVQKKPIFESRNDENSLQRKIINSESSEDDSIGNKLNSSGGNGTALPESVRKDLQPSFKSNLDNVNIHTDQKAAQMSDALNAQAFTKGNSIYFNKDKFNTSNKEGKHLLAHELTHVDQQTNNTNGSATAISRHPVEQTDVVRKERIDLFGDGTAIKPGIEFEKFESYTRRQADWFAAPSLSVADRANLWRLLFISTEGGFVLSGTRGLLLPELIPLGAVEWNNLKAFGRACNSSMNTVRIASAITYTLPQRLSLGAALLQLENTIPKEVLEFTVTEEQLKDIEAKPALIPQLSLYWFLFQPTLQQKNNKGGAGPGRNREFQQVLDFISTPFGIFPYLSLHGRVRNLHRFTTGTLDRLVINFNDTSHSKPLQLVLHSPHDSPGSFASDQPLIANLVANLDTLVLMLEGMGSLADITAEIPKIAATYGKADAKGVYRIAGVMISGHGETRNVSLAGTGAANTAGDKIEYPSESLDLDDAKQAKATEDLLDALLKNLDPATAKIVFNGCLVGSNIIPPGTPAADIPKYIAAHPNLKTFTESRAAALKLGMPADLVQGARASLATPDSLMDAKGNLEIKFKDDPDVFGTAAAYVATGHEPEGLIRSAIELAAIDPVAAAAQLQLRKAKGAKAGDWWEDVTVALVEMALDGVAVGAPVSLARLHTLSSFAQTIFLVRFDFGISVSDFVTINNADPVLAPIVYTKIAATNSFSAPSDEEAENMRMVVEQGRIALGQPREADLINFIGNKIPISRIENHLDTLFMFAKSSAFFPLGALSPGKIRLAIAWIRNDKTNADVIKFLDNEVTVTPAGPTFSADVQAELTTAGIPERDILELIGRIGAPPKGAKAKEKDKANAELNGDDKNDAYVAGKPYVATVIPTIYALNVRRLPSMAGKPFAWLHPGDKVNVMGFVHEWAAIDQNGHLGFVYKAKISAPPP